MKKVIYLATALMLIGCSDGPFKPDLPDVPDTPGTPGTSGGCFQVTSIFAKPSNIPKDLELRYVSWDKEGTEPKDTITVRLLKVEGETAYFEEVGYAIIAALDSNGMNYNEFAITMDGDYAYFKGHSRLFDHFVTGKNSLYMGTPTDELEQLNIMDDFLNLYNDVPDTYATIGKSIVHDRVYKGLSLYYDQTPAYVDGAGRALLYTREKGLVASQYFGYGLDKDYAGGYTLLEE